MLSPTALGPQSMHAPHAIAATKRIVCTVCFAIVERACCDTIHYIRKLFKCFLFLQILYVHRYAAFGRTIITNITGTGTGTEHELGWNCVALSHGCEIEFRTPDPRKPWYRGRKQHVISHSQYFRITRSSTGTFAHRSSRFLPLSTCDYHRFFFATMRLLIRETSAKFERSDPVWLSVCGVIERRHDRAHIHHIEFT